MVEPGQRIALHASWYPPVFLLDDVPRQVQVRLTRMKKNEERVKAGAARS